MTAAQQVQLDAACFRLCRLSALMDEAGMPDYRRFSRAQIDAARRELVCEIGRDRFRDGAQRYGEMLRLLGYEGYLLTGDWSAVRYFALRLARFECAKCAAGRELHVHHQTYERLCVELLADVIVLCGRCHARFHDLPHVEIERVGLRPIGLILDQLVPSELMRGAA